jgi:hypothetical protein
MSHDAARIAELERRVLGLTNALGAFSIGPLASRPQHGEMIGFPATAFPSTLSPEGSPHGMAGHNSGEDRARFVREHIRQRRARGDFFPADFFADPVWDMLLDLYAAHHEGHTVSVSSLCIAAAVPATTALRWIKSLTACGWFIRTRDETDGRRVYVHLSHEVLLKLDIYFDALQR